VSAFSIVTLVVGYLVGNLFGEVGLSTLHKWHRGKHNIKTNYVRGHGLVEYTEDEDPLWPQHNRIITNTFVTPVLPDLEIEVSPTLLPHSLRSNPNVTMYGPKLCISRRGRITISMVALRCGCIAPISPIFNPFSQVVPYTLHWTGTKVHIG